MKQTLVRVENNNMENVHSLLSDGWVIKSISACGTGGGGGSYAIRGNSYCYILLEKEG